MTSPRLVRCRSARLLAVAIAATGYILIGVQLEQRDLINGLGERYRAYRAKVPMFFPWPRSTRGSDG